MLVAKLNQKLKKKEYLEVLELLNEANEQAHPLNLASIYFYSLYKSAKKADLADIPSWLVNREVEDLPNNLYDKRILQGLWWVLSPYERSVLIRSNSISNTNDCAKKIAEFERKCFTSKERVNKSISQLEDEFLEKKAIFEKLEKFKFKGYPISYLNEFDKANIKGITKQNNKSITFVFCVKDRCERLAISLESLRISIKKFKEFESISTDTKINVLVVEELSDNYNSRELFDENQYNFINHVYLEDSGGWNRSRLANVGIELSGDGLIALCDADFIFPHDFVKNLFLYEGNIDFDVSVALINCFETHSHYKDGLEISGMSPYGYMWIFDKKIASKIKGFDERYSGHGFEDRDFQRRLEREDIRIVRFPISTSLNIFHLSHNHREGSENRNNNKALYDLNTHSSVMNTSSSAKLVKHRPQKKSYIFYLDNGVAQSGYDEFKLLVSKSPCITFARGVVAPKTAKHIVTGQNFTIIDALRELDFSNNVSFVQFIPSESFAKEFYSTARWLNNFGFNINYLLGEVEEQESIYRNEFNVIDDLQVLDLSVKGNGLISDIKERLRPLKISHFDKEAIARIVRSNIKADNSLVKVNSSLLPWTKSERRIFIDEVNRLYLLNKFYNEFGYYEKDLNRVNSIYTNHKVHRNYLSSLAEKDYLTLTTEPKEILRNSTVILLDPTCDDQRSGISSYLVNMYKFFKMSRLVENVIYFKNPYPSTMTDNRDKYRDLVANTFNHLSDFSNNVVFIDSEAHYPGIGLKQCFRKIVITHCSSLLAAKLDKKLPKKLSENLLNIASLELENIRSASVVVSPTLNHDKVQRRFYESIGLSVPNYTANYLVNYINDPYKEFVHFRDRTFDLVFVGRAQILKGFDKIVALASSAKEVKVAVITNHTNEMTDQLSKLPNVSLMLGLERDSILRIVADSKMLIDLSAYHNCSTVFLEALSCKTPAILIDIPNYREMINGSDIDKYCLFVSNTDNQKSLTNHIIRKIKNLESYRYGEDIEKIDRDFNSFLLNNYIYNFSFYRDLFSKFGLKRKFYTNSTRYAKLLEGKTVVNVVQSPSLKNGDDEFIDKFDLIVRFNKGVATIVPEKHGSRTDILYNCMNKSPESGNMTRDFYNEYIVNKVKWVSKAYPSLDWSGSFSFDQDHRAGCTADNLAFEVFNQSPRDCSEFSKELFQLVESFIDCRPNTGVTAILDLIQYPIKSLYLKGYTFFKGGYDFMYRQQNENEVMEYMAKAGHHNQYRQNLFIRKIILSESNINIDSELKAILNNM